ncbi:MAG: hypothetical protein IPJ49_06750 [Candidatus Obscuribacter sp.]|nr:hypothetical protein [Candidatus Obscuribacter sp.]
MTEAIGTPAFRAIAKTLLLQVDHRWKLQQEAYRIAQSGGMLSYGGMGEHFGFQLVVGDCMVEQVRGVLKSDLDTWGIDYVQAVKLHCITWANLLTWFLWPTILTEDRNVLSLSGKTEIM